jgi:hypothetical protein
MEKLGKVISGKRTRFGCSSTTSFFLASILLRRCPKIGGLILTLGNEQKELGKTTEHLANLSQTQKTGLRALNGNIKKDSFT